MDEQLNDQPPPPVEPKSQISTPLAMAIGALVMVVVVGFITSMGGSKAEAPAASEPLAPAAATAPAAGTGAANAAMEANMADGVPADLASRPPAGLTPDQLAAVNAMTKVMADTKAGRSAMGYESLKSTLRGLTTAQEVEYSMNNSYASELSKLRYDAAPDVTVRVHEGTVNGWAGEATKTGVQGSCVVFVGSVKITPRTKGGKVATSQAYPVCDS